MIKVLGSVFVSVSMVAVVYAVVYLKHRYSNDDSELDYRNAYGQYGLEFLIGCVMFLWIVPYGILVIVPLVLILSSISPAGRASWQKFGKIRTYAVVSMLVVLLMGGFVPTSEPKSPDEWGEPLFTENPNAPIYPAGTEFDFEFKSRWCQSRRGILCSKRHMGRGIGSPSCGPSNWAYWY